MPKFRINPQTGQLDRVMSDEEFDGDLLNKSGYDTDDNGIIDKAETLDDGLGNTIAPLTILNTQSLNVYVDVNRTDSYTADGTIHKPYKTISTALSNITDASASKEYTVMIASGTYDETVTAKEYVSLKGIGAYSKVRLFRTSGGSALIIHNLAGTATNGLAISISNMTIGGTSSPVISLVDTDVNFETCFIYGNGAQAIDSDSSNWLGARFWNCSIVIDGTVSVGVLCNNSNTGGNYAMVNFFNTAIAGQSSNITTLVKVTGDSGSPNSVILAHSLSMWNQANTTLEIDNGGVVSWGLVRCAPSQLVVNGIIDNQLLGDIHTQGDLFLKSGGKISDTSSEATIADIKDSVDKKHTQGTDAGTSGDFSIAGELTIKVYSQDGEPTLDTNNKMAMWIDTNDSNKVYLIFRRGSGDQVTVELS